MTISTENALAQQVDGTAETIRAYVAQIESGEYGQGWQTQDSDGDWRNWVADDREHAAEQHIDAFGSEPIDVQHVQADEPTIDDTPISEHPLEIVDERGKEFAVVLSTGGPHIEIVADGLSSARLEGYWAGERVTRYGDYLSTFLDYFIDRESE